MFFRRSLCECSGFSVFWFLLKRTPKKKEEEETTRLVVLVCSAESRFYLRTSSVLLLLFFFIVVVQPVRSGVQYKSVISGSVDLKATSASFVFVEQKRKIRFSRISAARSRGAHSLHLSRPIGLSRAVQRPAGDLNSTVRAPLPAQARGTPNQSRISID